MIPGTSSRVNWKRLFAQAGIYLWVVILAACGFSTPVSNTPGETQNSLPRLEASKTYYLPLPPTSLPPVNAPEPTAASTPVVQRPNILFILTDDLDTLSMSYMPYVRELLVSQGITFTNYIVNVSVCCPSRATTLLGQYAHNTKILTNSLPNGGYERFYAQGQESKTIAVALQAAGYRTALIGKYLNGYPNGVSKTYIPPGWSEWYAVAGGSPYLEYNYTVNQNGKLVNYARKADDYATDVMAGQAVDFIQRSAAGGQPFFLYLATYAPHGPSVPARRHLNLFEDVQMPLSPAFNEADVSDKPAHIQALSLLKKSEKTDLQNLFIRRIQSLQAVDEMVQNLVQTLKDTGQYDNTYIFFTSDNGFHLGDHRLPAGKQSPYEADIRVPFIIRGPGIMPMQRRDELVGNVDLAPTWAELSGATMPTDYDGRSLAALLFAQPRPEDWRGAYLIEHTPVTEAPEESSAGLLQLRDTGILEPPDWMGMSSLTGNTIEIPQFYGLRTEGYLYVEYDTGERELYDLKADPYELDNLVSSASADLLARFSEWLKLLRGCVGEGCRSQETGVRSQ